MLVIHERPSSNVKREATTFLLRQLTKDSVPTLFLSSGGSALTLLEEKIALPQTNHITIGMIDERFSDDSRINNYAQALKRPLVQSILDHGGETIFTLPQKSQSHKNFATQYESALINWLSQHPNGKIIATLGIGQDGHIAAIFPESPDLFNQHYIETDNFVHYHTSSHLPVFPKRITVTGRLLRKVDCAIVFAVGEPKRSVVHEVLFRTDIDPSLPASIIHILPMVHFYTDVF